MKQKRGFDIMGKTSLRYKLLAFCVSLFFISSLIGCKKNIENQSISEESHSRIASEKRSEEHLALFLKEQSISRKLDPDICFKPKACEYLKKAFEKEWDKEPSGSEKLVTECFGFSKKEALDYLRLSLEVDPNFHASHYWLGLSLIQPENLEESEALLKKAIELKPKYATQYIKLSNVYEKKGDLKKAVDVLLQGEKNCDTDGNYHKHFGNIYMELGNYQAAVNEYKKIKKESIYIYKPFLLSNAYANSGDFVNSWKNFKKANYLPTEESETQKYLQPYLEEKAIGKYEAIASRARIYYLLKRYEKAKQLYFQCLEKYPNRFDQHYEIGDILYNEDKYKSAYSHFLKAAKQEGGHFGAYISLGYISSYEPTKEDKNNPEKNVTTDFDKAIEFYKKAIEINGEAYRPYYFIGQIYIKQENYSEALQFASLAESKGKDAEIYSLKARAFQGLGDIEKKLEYLWKAFEEKESFNNRLELLFALNSAESYDEYEDLLDDSIEKYPGVTSFQIWLADTYKEQGKTWSAILEYLEVVAKTDSASVNSNLASCYFTRNDFDNAAFYYAKAFEKGAGATDAYNAGAAFYNLGNWEKAAHYCEQAYKAQPEFEEASQLLDKCKYFIELENYPEKLNSLSAKEGETGLIAKLLIVADEYSHARDLRINGWEETKPEYGYGNSIVSYNVSSKIYEAQGICENLVQTLDSLKTSGTLSIIANDLKNACRLEAAGIDEWAKGFYIPKKDYRGEFEKGMAKINLADKTFLNALKNFKKPLFSKKSLFGEVALNKLENLIEFYEGQVKK